MLILYREDVLRIEVEKLTEGINQKIEDAKSYEHKVEFLEQSFLTKANFFTKNEKKLLERIKSLENEIEIRVSKEQHLKDMEKMQSTNNFFKVYRSNAN